jgi:serine protease
MQERSGLGRRTFLRLSGFAGVAGIPGVASASPGRKPGPKPNEWLVGVSVSTDNCGATVASHLPDEASVVHENNSLGYASVEFSEQVREQATESLSSAIEETGPIKYFEKNDVCHAQFIPNDPKYDIQYVDEKINAPQAWEETLGSADVTIAVVDQGVKYDHPDLEDNIADNPGRDFVDNDGDPYPDDLSSEPHGTHVAGIAAASVDNGTGVSGIGNSTILSLRVLNGQGRGAISGIADAVEWATDQGADVINLSLGGAGDSQTMQNAVSYAVAHDTLVIAAAGNSGQSEVDYPAAYSDCIAVSALDPDGTFAEYSNSGSDIELTAPGTNVVSTWSDDGYKAISGTSMSSPVVAGVAGLTLAQWDLTNEELRTHLRETAVDVSLPDSQQGVGRVDAGAAVTTQPGSANEDTSNNGGNNEDTSNNGGNNEDTSNNGGNNEDTPNNGNNTDSDNPGKPDSITSTVKESLVSSQDENYYSYEWGYDNPSKIVLTLDGPSDADFDIYAAEGSETLPDTNSFNYASKASNSHERITIENPDHSTDLYIIVDSYSGDGKYTLTLSEYA